MSRRKFQPCWHCGNVVRRDQRRSNYNQGQMKFCSLDCLRAAGAKRCRDCGLAYVEDEQDKRIAQTLDLPQTCPSCVKATLVKVMELGQSLQKVTHDPNIETDPYAVTKRTNRMLVRDKLGTTRKEQEEAEITAAWWEQVLQEQRLQQPQSPPQQTEQDAADAAAAKAVMEGRHDPLPQPPPMDANEIMRQWMEKTRQEDGKT